jgi:hypothetical protein
VQSQTTSKKPLNKIKEARGPKIDAVMTNCDGRVCCAAGVVSAEYASRKPYANEDYTHTESRSVMFSLHRCMSRSVRQM